MKKNLAKISQLDHKAGGLMKLLPNILTILRIVLIPFYLYLFLAGNYLMAGIIFSFSALTDFLDGYFARKYQLKTELGRILDPFADKLTIISILLALVFSGIIPRFIAIILLSRELFIFISSIVVYLLGIDCIQPSNIGKVSIFLLYLAIIFRLLGSNHIAMVLFYIVIPLNVISGLDYVLKAIKKLSK
ncbi:MAG: CDP-diacylglycerol--glycerol-3-phosphate 3-phosphatidyltransferase [Halanaerobiales bacterium]|nr:CDP-diacylglycerol--glycerol-3-phosphate 3-phosphatidyltransferase [Halanaerobiales bacterium]